MNSDTDSKREKALAAIELLEKIYPSALCALTYDGEPWKLLVMARLSAQCTDKRVNTVCETLFHEYPTPNALADADISRVMDIVRPCGLYRVKAADIISCAKRLVTVYGGVLPDSMEELLTFDGVGRKVANLLLGDIYKKPAVVVDTHCIRITKRLGLIDENVKQPEKIEKYLSLLLPPEKQSDFCHRIVMLGREYCPARGYDCAVCPLNKVCANANKTEKGCAKQ